jgi:hypothetical protein
MGSTITPYAAHAARIMITNDGPHPADFWAQVTAEHIAPISDDMTGARRVVAMKLQADIMAALMPHHVKVQENEKSKIAADPAHHLLAVDPETHTKEFVAESLKDIEAAAKGTEWEKHFAFGHSKPDWLDAHLKDISDMGGDAKPLTADQQAQIDSWTRQNLIHDEIMRHFATAQHIERSWHADRLAGRA